MTIVLKLKSAEFDDHREIRINADWVKMYYQHEAGITHVILGDGYPSDQFPVECIPVLETPDEIDRLLHHNNVMVTEFLKGAIDA
jgi:hypothetical protein